MTNQSDQLDRHAAGGPPDEGLATRITGWDDLLLNEDSVDQALEIGLEVARRVLANEPAVSITVRPPDGGEAHTRAATAPRAERLDQWQYVNGEGPCITADAELAVCTANDLAEDELFPDFDEVAIDLGVRAVASFPLVVRERSIGSLNLFYGEAGVIDEASIDLGRQLAAALSPMLANFLTHQRSVRLTEQLEEALEGRSVIERAKGLMMERLGIQEDRAFELLSTQSQHENRKVREIAAEMLAQHDRRVAPDGR